MESEHALREKFHRSLELREQGRFSEAQPLLQDVVIGAAEAGYGQLCCEAALVVDKDFENQGVDLATRLTMLRGAAGYGKGTPAGDIAQARLDSLTQRGSSPTVGSGGYDDPIVGETAERVFEMAWGMIQYPDEAQVREDVVPSRLQLSQEEVATIMRGIGLARSRDQELLGPLLAEFAVESVIETRQRGRQLWEMLQSSSGSQESLFAGGLLVEFAVAFVFRRFAEGQ